MTTHDADDLLEDKREADDERVGLVDDRPLELVVDRHVVEAEVVD